MIANARTLLEEGVKDIKHRGNVKPSLHSSPKREEIKAMLLPIVESHRSELLSVKGRLQPLLDEQKKLRQQQDVKKAPIEREDESDRLNDAFFMRFLLMKA